MICKKFLKAMLLEFESTRCNVVNTEEEFIFSRW